MDMTLLESVIWPFPAELNYFVEQTKPQLQIEAA